MTDDELEALCELRDQLFASPATESVPGEGSNPSVLRSDNAARFAAYLLADDDTIDGYEAEPPAPWTPRILDTY